MTAVNKHIALINFEHSLFQGGDEQFSDAGIQCNRPPFSLDYYIQHIIRDPNDFQFYTGLSLAAFEVLYEFLGGQEVCSKLKYNFAPQTPTRERYSEHSPKDKLFITLIRPTTQRFNIKRSETVLPFE